MDFEMRYTPEQERFRGEVREWMDVHAGRPPGLGDFPFEVEYMTREQWEWIREFHRELGAKGWFYPMMPAEHGGGGLTMDHDIILKEELLRYKVPHRHSPGDMAIAPLFVYGTDEQKQRLLAPILRGEIVSWQLWTEPEAGVDVAAIKMRATKDGDDYLFSGTKIYITGVFEPDFFNILVVTDPDAPRHANLGHFFIPATLPGISWTDMELIVGRAAHIIYFDNVRVSRDYLIGGETQGWRVTNSSLELMHGAEGGIVGRGDYESFLEAVMGWWREEGGPLGRSIAHGERARTKLVEAYIDAKVNRHLSRRAFWMFSTKQPQTYQGVHTTISWRETSASSAEDLLEVLGPFALTTDRQWSPLGGRVEHNQRDGLMNTHGGGTYDIDKVIMARRIGLSRTKETAAPTH